MLGELIGAGLSALGGFLGRQQQSDQAAQNIALQREFAQNGIQWKVRDAQKAGIHPLYALGASTTSFSPVSVGGSPMGDALTSMGQNVTRAASAYTSAQERQAATVANGQQIASNSLDLEAKKLQIEILKSRLATMSQPGTPPPVADQPVPFPVTENPKPEQRPPLMLLGNRWMTNPNTSPMKAYEDQYGDEGPASWILPPIIGANDALYNAVYRYKRFFGIPQERGGGRAWLEQKIFGGR